MTALLLALMASAPPTFFLPPGLPREVQRQLLDDIYSDTTVDPVLLEFMPASGTGAVPGVGDMCNWMQLGGYLSGSYTCLQGDGSVYASPGMGLTEVGSPEHDEWATCSNGPDCTPRSGARTDGSGTQRWVTPAQATFTGDFWGCWGGVVDPRASTQYMLAKYTGSAADQSFTFNAGATAYSLTLGTNPGLATVASVSSGWTPGALQVACFTFDRDASGTHTVRLYLDGSKGATATTTTTPLPATGASYAVSAGSLGAAALSGRVMFAAVGDGLPSDADMVRMANAFLGTLTGTKNEGLALSRNTVSTCCRDDGTGCVVLPPGRACWAGGKLKVRPVVANLLGQSSAFDVAATWPTFVGGTAGTTTVAADAAVGRNGTRTADLLSVGATTAGGDFTGIQQGLSGTAGAYTCYVDAMAQSGTPTLNIIIKGSVLTAQNCVLSPTSFTRCAVSVASTTPTFFAIGNDTRSTGPTQGAFGVYIADAQCTATAAALDYCPTGAAPASCAQEAWAMPKPSALSSTEGCARICVTPTWTGATPTGTGSYAFLLGNAAGNANFFYSNPNNTAIQSWNGSVAVAPAALFATGVTKCYRNDWNASGNFFRITREEDGAVSTNTFTGFGAITNVNGGNTAAVPFAISSLKIGNAPGVCTP